MSDTKNAAIKSITAAMETETGRKIIVSKMLSLVEDNKRLRRKVAEDRIAVHSLNELTIMVTKILNHNYIVFQESDIPIDPKSSSLIKSLNAYRSENFGEEMVQRINDILNDTEGDDILLHDLIGNQPKEVSQ